MTLGGRTGVAYAVLIGAMLIGAVLSPLLAVTVPPLLDYPDHLARMAILAGKAPAAMQNYIAHWRLLPNLAMDVVVPPLAQLMPVETAGRVFVGLAMVLPVFGTIAVHHALYGRVGLWPLCSLLFVFNAALWFGLVNFLFSLGVALFAFACWIGSEGWQPALRLAVFSLVAALMFILHLFAFGIYGLLIASYELGERFLRRRGSIAGMTGYLASLAQFVPVFVLWLLSGADTGARFTEFGSPADKLQALLSPVSFNLPPTLLDYALAGFCLFAIYVALRSRAVAVHHSMLVPIIVLLAAGIVMPKTMLDGTLADSRLLIGFAFVLIAATEPVQARRKLAIPLVFVGLALIGLRVWAVAQSWRDFDERFAEFRGAAQQMPEGSRLLVVQSEMPAGGEEFADVPRALALRSAVAFIHMPALAVIDRGAFVPNLFLHRQPLDVTARNAELIPPSRPYDLGILTPEELVARADASLRAATAATPDARSWGADWPKHYDFVLWIDFGEEPANLPARLEPWARGSFFHLYRVSKT